MYVVLSLFLTVLSLSACALSPSLSPDQAKLEQAKLAAKVMNVATPGTSVGCSGADCAGAELKNSAVQAELKTMQKGLGIFFYFFRTVELSSPCRRASVFARQRASERREGGRERERERERDCRFSGLVSY
jgi:hypothetical protein